MSNKVTSIVQNDGCTVIVSEQWTRMEFDASGGEGAVAVTIYENGDMVIEPSPTLTVLGSFTFP